MARMRNLMKLIMADKKCLREGELYLFHRKLRYMFKLQDNDSRHLEKQYSGIIKNK